MLKIIYVIKPMPLSENTRGVSAIGQDIRDRCRAGRKEVIVGIAAANAHALAMTSGQECSSRR